MKTGKVAVSPCPFCGSTKIGRMGRKGRVGAAYQSQYYRGYYKCRDCGATSGVAKNPDSALRLWDKRASSPYKEASLSELYLVGAEAIQALKATILELEKKNLELSIKYEGLPSTKEKIISLEQELDFLQKKVKRFLYNFGHIIIEKDENPDDDFENQIELLNLKCSYNEIAGIVKYTESFN